MKNFEIYLKNKKIWETKAENEQEAFTSLEEQLEAREVVIHKKVQFKESKKNSGFMNMLENAVDNMR